MSKSSANPRRYSKGREGLDPNEALIVYVELRVPREDLGGVKTRFEYMNNRRPQAVLSVYGVRREPNQYVMTVGVDMGSMRTALRGTSVRMQAGYDLLWDIWEQCPEFTPVFASPPGPLDRASARSIFGDPAMVAPADL